ncbi:MAG: hypothetical protein ACRDJV_09185 [Actinomycetota bacterium]
MPTRPDEMSEDQGRYVPLPIKRQLRQEAGVGCCKCGLPIIQYHHIVPFADDAHNRPEDMMVLCPNHHDEANDGAVSEGEQRQIKAAPFNIQRGYTDGVLKVNQTHLCVDMGFLVVAEGAVVRTENEELFKLGLRENRLSLSLRLYDERNRLRAAIKDNEWVSGKPELWDIEAGWQRLTLRQKRGEISLRIDAKREPVLVRGKLREPTVRMELYNDEFRVYWESSSKSAGMRGDICLVGGFFTLHDDHFTLQPFESLKGCTWFPEPDPIRRLAKGLNMHSLLKRGLTVQEANARLGM